MVLIIQKDRTNVDYFNNNVKVLRSICDLKTYEQTSYTIVLIDISIDKDGVVEFYNFAFEELLVSLDVIAVITNIESDKLKEICDYYKIALLVNKY